MIHVVGGVYFERCLFPPWNQLYGSAGRAAALIAQNDSPVTLHSYISSSATDDLQTISGVYGFATVRTESPTTYAFDYVHPLAEPKVIPPRPTAPCDPIPVSEDLVLRFGMIEGDALVHARIAVYDPQSAFSPAAFEANGSAAERLTVIMNVFEALSITHASNVDAALSELLSSSDVAIIKQGAAGALVGTAKHRRMIPAYRTESTFSIYFRRPRFFRFPFFRFACPLASTSLRVPSRARRRASDSLISPRLACAKNRRSCAGVHGTSGGEPRACDRERPSIPSRACRTSCAPPLP